MRGSLVLSVTFHAAILGWAVFTIHSQPPLRVPELEPLAVDLVTPGDVTRLREGSRTAKQLDAQPKELPKSEPSKKEAEKPRPVASAPPPPPEPPPPKPEPKSDPIADKLASIPPAPAQQTPPPAAPPPPAPSIEEQKKLEELMKEQERQAEEQRRREEQKKQAEVKKKADEEKKKLATELKKKREEEKKRREAEAKKKQEDEFKKISALLNKVPDKGAPPPSPEPSEPTKNRGPVLGAPEGRDRQLSASELAILAQIIKSCVQSKWTVMGGGEGAQHVLVKLRLRFNPDGRLAGAPTIMNPQTSPFFLAISDSAVRAVQACEPFPLPPAKYDVWKDIVLNFDPRDMF